MKSGRACKGETTSEESITQSTVRCTGLVGRLLELLAVAPRSCKAYLYRRERTFKDSGLRCDFNSRCRVRVVQSSKSDDDLQVNGRTGNG